MELQKKKKNKAETTEVTNLAYCFDFPCKCARSFLNWSRVRHEVKMNENHCPKQCDV